MKKGLEKNLYMKQYRLKNKEKVKEARDRYLDKSYICSDCGDEITNRTKKKHICSKIKPEWMVFVNMTEQLEVNIIKKNDVGLVTQTGKFYNIYLFV